MIRCVNTILMLIAILAITGCAGHRAFQYGERYESLGQYDQAVSSYQIAVEKTPGQQEYRVKLLRVKQLAAFSHMDKGEKLLSENDPAGAIREFAQALEYDPSLDRAEQFIVEAQRKIKRNTSLEEADELFRLRRFPQAKKILNTILEDEPENQEAIDQLSRLNKRTSNLGGFELALESNESITLTFKDTPAKDAFVILSRLSGINFIFDEDVKNKEITLLLEESSFNQALELLLVMAELDRKVLNPKTILLYPNSRDKKKQYEEQIIQTFYLSNIDAKKAVNLLRTMLQLRKVYVHEELNAIVVRDNPDTIELASQILVAADRADAEVVFDLELVEISHNDSQDLGLGLSRYGVDAGLFSNGKIVSSSLEGDNLVSSLSGLKGLFTLPSATFNFAKTLSDSEVLASPKIRVRNKGKAKVHVGSREPVITVTNNNGTTSENVQYVDVGVKLDVEPTVNLDNTISTKINLEVSNVASRQETATGTAVLTLSTTNATTELSLKDGEQTIIGGLIREEDSNGKTTIPIIGDLPIIGSLFGSRSTEKIKREILLSITPHIVKQLMLPELKDNRLWSGAEDDLKAGPSLGYYFPEEEYEELQDQSSRSVPVDRPDLNVEPPGLIVPTPTMSAEKPPVNGSGQVIVDAQVPISKQQSGEVTDSQQAGSPGLEMQDGLVQSESQQTSAQLLTVPTEERIVISEEIPAISSGGLLFIEGPKLVDSDSAFSVKVMVDEISQLYSAPFFITYDAEVVEFASAEEGEFLRNGSVPTLFTTSVDQRSGRVIIGMKQGVGGQGISGGGDLVTIHFRAKQTGRTVIRADRINFRNPQGKRLSISDEALEVEVR